MRIAKSLIIGFSAALAFAVVAAVLLRTMPQPLQPTDALVVGSVATLAGLITLFAGYLFIAKPKDVLFRKRIKKTD